MNFSTIETRAAEMRRRLGGTIFSFPINENDPGSKYAVTIFVGPGFRTFPTPLTIEEAAAGVRETLEGMKELGMGGSFEHDVRFVVGEAQMNAPNVTMRRLKKSEAGRAPLEQGVDVVPNPDDPGSILFSARGVLKFSIIEMFERNPKAVKLLDGYCKLLASKQYGKTAAAIKQEVLRMGKHEALRWAERTYTRYITDSREVLNLLGTSS